VIAGKKPYSNHWPSLLDDHEPGPVAMFNVSAESSLDDNDVLPEKLHKLSEAITVYKFNQ
jgi:hypothetical protein